MCIVQEMFWKLYRTVLKNCYTHFLNNIFCIDVQNKIRFTNSQKIYLEVGIIKIVNTIDENLDILEKIHKLEQNSGTNTSGAVYNNEYDNRINIKR